MIVRGEPAVLPRPATRSALRDRVAQYTVNEVNSYKREEFVDEFEQLMKRRAIGSGLIIESVYIRNIAFSDEYAEAVEEKQMAFQGMTRAVHQAKQIENLSRGKAEKIKILAEADATAIVIEGQSGGRGAGVKGYCGGQGVASGGRGVEPSRGSVDLPLH